MPFYLVISTAGLTLAAAHLTPLDSLLRARPSDSLATSLAHFETERGHLGASAEAALVLGQLYFAHGQYRHAVDAFGRAAARLDPTRKHEARYWLGLSWLALGDGSEARAAFEEVAESGSPRRALAMLGIADAWALAEKPERELETLDRLLRGDPGEAGPSALERFAALAERYHRPADARRARERLMRSYPASLEAARAAWRPLTDAGVGTAATGKGPISVQIGAFSDAQRARALADAARAAGFSATRIVTRGEGSDALQIVQLGSFASLDEARVAAERAERRLGVNARLVREP